MRTFIKVNGHVKNLTKRIKNVSREKSFDRVFGWLEIVWRNRLFFFFLLFKGLKIYINLVNVPALYYFSQTENWVDYIKSAWNTIVYDGQKLSAAFPREIQQSFTQRTIFQIRKSAFLLHFIRPLVENSIKYDLFIR